MSDVLTEERIEIQVEDQPEEEPEERPGYLFGAGEAQEDEEAAPCDGDEGEEDADETEDGGRIFAEECASDDLDYSQCPYGVSAIDPDRPSSRDITTKELGKRGEDAAANYLVRKGYQILERNWTCRFGEADIIALDEEGTIVFVEVKTRRSSDCGLPEEAVTRAKQRRYERIALAYLMEADWDEEANLRFDAIGISVTGDFKAILKHHKGCFDGMC